MLYETAARAGELLSLNIEDLGLEFRTSWPGKQIVSAVVRLRSGVASSI